MEKDKEKEIVWYKGNDGNWYNDKGLKYYIDENIRLKAEIERLRRFYGKI